MSALPESISAIEKNPIEFPGIIIESIIHKLGNINQLAHIAPINVTAITITLERCVHKIQYVTEMIKNQRIHQATTDILVLRSTISDVFDIISQNGNLLEYSLKDDGCKDLAIRDVEIALQVLIDSFLSSNLDDIVDAKEETQLQETESETAVSSVYCLSTALKIFLTTASDLAHKLNTSNKNLVNGFRTIVQSVLNIVDTVVRGLISVQALDRFSNDPSLIELSLVIAKLANPRINFFSNLTDATVVSSLSVLTLQQKVEHLPFITYNNIANLEVYLLSSLKDLPALHNIISAIVVRLKQLQTNLTNLSNSVHLIHKISDSVAYSSDTSMENLVVTVKCLTYYITYLPVNLFIREFHEMIGPNFQTILLLIPSNLQTLTDEISLIVERSLTDLICTSSRTDTLNLKNQLIALQTVIEPIVSIIENIIKTSIEIVRNLMNSVLTIEQYYPAYDSEVAVFYSDTRQFVYDLDRILKEMTKNLDNRLSKPARTLRETRFSICTKAFEEAAAKSIKLSALFNKSVEQIQRYLIE